MAQDIRFHLDPLWALAKEIRSQGPAGRNTAPAIGLAAIDLHKRCPESVMIIMPPTMSSLMRTTSLLTKQLSRALKGYLYLGIKPMGLKQAGYIGSKTLAQPTGYGLFRVERFLENRSSGGQALSRETTSGIRASSSGRLPKSSLRSRTVFPDYMKR
jgi:hypothetical protein